MEKKDKPSADSFDFEEDDIIDLSVTLQDDEIIDLTSPVNPSGGDEAEELLDLDAYIAEKGGLQDDEADKLSFDDTDDVIDLVQSVDDVEDDDIIELVETVSKSAVSPFSFDEDEDVIELTESVTQILGEDEDVEQLSPMDGGDDTIDLVEPVTQGLDSDDDFSIENIISDEDDVIDLEIPAVIAGIDGLDEDIIDLTQTVVDEDDVIDLDTPAVISESDGLDDDTIDLTQTVDEDDVIDLETPAVVAADDELDDDIIDLTQATGDEDVIDLTQEIPVEDDSLDDMLEEIELDLDGPAKATPAFDQFAEQTTDNLQFDLSESLSGESSKHTILNAEPVKKPFDFESFAEQTTDKMSFLANVEAHKGKNEQAAAEKAEITDLDIDKEIMNLSLDSEDLEGMDSTELDATVEMSELPSSSSRDKEDLLKELDDTFDSEVIELSDILSDDAETIDSVDDDLLDSTWDGSGEPSGGASDELEFDEIEDLIPSPRDDDRAIAEALGLDLTDERSTGDTDDEAKLKAMGITREQLDLSVERVIRKIYGEKLDEIFKQVIGRSISEDMERIKEVLKSGQKDE
ncbi:MAG: hypothetical protein WC799_15460 [Desulfobacteraceae bacterium]|jgi:hypothetical protein